MQTACQNTDLTGTKVLETGGKDLHPKNAVADLGQDDDKKDQGAFQIQNHGLVLYHGLMVNVLR